MSGDMRRLYARKRPRDDEECEGEEGAKRRHAARARAESGAVDGSAAESAQGVTTTHVARGDEDTSGVARAVGESTKKTTRNKLCVLCKRAKATRVVIVHHHGSLISNIFGPILKRFSRTKRTRIGTIDPTVVFCKGDALCGTCASHSEHSVRDPSDRALEHRIEDTRKLGIFAEHVQKDCHGKLPRFADFAELAGWDDERDGEARVEVGSWWYQFTILNDGVRKKRVVEAAARDDDTATRAALQYLATCEKRNHSECDVEGDSRRVRILAKHVQEKCHGKLPRITDCAELEGWDHESAGEAHVQVGQWFYNFTTRNDGVRKKRVVEVAEHDDDTATQKALQYLAECKARDDGRFDVEVDSRRVRILAEHVQKECDGKLPRAKDFAKLSGWDDERDRAARVPVGMWFYHFTTKNDGARKKRVVEAAERNDDAATRVALQYLAECPQRDSGNDYVKYDSRRVRILAEHVQKDCHGKLPRKADCAKLSGWDDESAGEAHVQVGLWWYHFTTKNDGARKKRVVEAAEHDDDTATREALQYLATCAPRDIKKRGR